MRSISILMLLMVLGCGEEVRVYEVPKEATPAHAVSPAAQPAPERDSSPVLAWEAPEGWVEQPASAMRQGSFLVPTENGELDVSVISFPGLAGGILANVNRWRGQVGMDPISEQELAAQLIPLPTRAGIVSYVELLPEQGEGTIGGILPYQGDSWFFKMTGTVAGVESQRENYLEWLQTLHPAQSAATAEATAAGALPPTDRGGSQPKVEAPAHWVPTEISSMRVASFQIPGERGVADLSVIPLKGDGGGVLANVNRWRGQLDLPPVTEEGLSLVSEPITVGGHTGIWVAMRSEGPVGEQGFPLRVLAAIVDDGESSWFFKLAGENELVAQEQEQFRSWVEQFPLAE